MKYMKNKLEMMKNSKLAYLFIKFAGFCRFFVATEPIEPAVRPVKPEPRASPVQWPVRFLKLGLHH